MTEKPVSPSPLIVSAAAASRFLKAALLLDRRIPSGPGAVRDIVKKLELVQMDPVQVVARNHDLVLFNRIEGYRPEHFETALETGQVFEYICGNRSIIPAEEYPFFMPFMRLREKQLRDRLDELSAAAKAAISILEREGPLPSRLIESEEKVSGYWDSSDAQRTKATTHALQLLWDSGRVIAGGRRNGEIIFDIPERAVPRDLLKAGEKMTEHEAREHLRRKYYRAYRLFDAGHPLFGFQHMRAAERREALKQDVERGLIMPVEISGVKREYFCLSEDVKPLQNAQAASESRDQHDENAVADALNENHARILSPLDNLLWRRERLLDLYGFFYRWELYTPAAKRQYGPYTMPVVAGNSIPLRIDLKYERAERELAVQKVYRENHLPETVDPAGILHDELERLKEFLGAQEPRE